MTLEEKEEYYSIIYEILENDEFQKRKQYKHHGNISVYEHSLAVSKYAYIVAKRLGYDYKSVAIGGLLHDFYYKPWQENIEKVPLLKKHGFVHAREALENSKNIFPHLINKKVANIIERHMFPLNKIPPRYAESWIDNLCDKYVSLEVIKEPKKIPMLFGIKKGV